MSSGAAGKGNMRLRSGKNHLPGGNAPSRGPSQPTWQLQATLYKSPQHGSSSQDCAVKLYMSNNARAKALDRGFSLNRLSGVLLPSSSVSLLN
jgi:hypothetical protein